MVGRLERDGYITRGSDRAIAFTDSGAAYAEGIVRRHRLIERFLTDVLGVPWDEVHEEAERLEHAMRRSSRSACSPRSATPKTCPHGHPIVAGARLAGVPLADVEVGASVRVLRFENEAEDLLHYLSSRCRAGHDAVMAERDAEHVALRSADGRRLALTTSVAETVSVIAEPARRRAPRCPSSWSSASATAARASVALMVTFARVRAASSSTRLATGCPLARAGGLAETACYAWAMSSFFVNFGALRIATASCPSASRTGSGRAMLSSLGATVREPID